MRGWFIFILILGWVPLILFKPHVGILLWSWVSHMNPHKYTYGFAYNFEFLNFVGGATLLGLFVARDGIKLPAHPILFSFLFYFLWVSFTTIASYDGALSLQKLEYIGKVLLFSTLSVVLMRSPNRLKAFTYVIGLSLAYPAVKGGIFTLVTGAGARVQGAGGMIGDNNQLAMALAMCLPLALWFYRNPPLPILRWPLLGAAFCFALATIGTQSRGGFAALSAVVFMLLLKSRRKIAFALMIIPIAVGIYAFTPDNLRARFASTGEATEDTSFLGRVSMWKFSVNLTEEHPFEGGGFRVFEMRRPIELFMPVGYIPRAPHSIYFEVLGEHGYVGLLLFMTMIFTGWYVGGDLAKRLQGDPETRWLGELAAAMQLGIVGYAVGGLTVNIATFDLFYDFLAILVMIDVVSRKILADRALGFKMPEPPVRKKRKKFSLPA